MIGNIFTICSGRQAAVGIETSLLAWNVVNEKAFGGTADYLCSYSAIVSNKTYWGIWKARIPLSYLTSKALGLFVSD